MTTPMLQLIKTTPDDHSDVTPNQNPTWWPLRCYN